jgi:hypothetical protein
MEQDRRQTDVRATGEGPGDDDGAGLAALAEGDVDVSTLTRTARVLGRSARAAGAGAVASGRWLASEVVDQSPRIRIRSYEMLVADHEGLTGPALSAELIKRATRRSAAIGALSGALMGAEELAPPAWVSLPLELVVETLAVALIEMKLIGELHAATGRPVGGTASERGMAIVRAWADRRGVTAATFAAGGGVSELLGRGTRKEVVKLVRRRLIRRMGKNLTSLAPLMAGAAAAATVNRRATRSLGEAVMRDLTAASAG